MRTGKGKKSDRSGGGNWERGKWSDGKWGGELEWELGNGRRRVGIGWELTESGIGDWGRGRWSKGKCEWELGKEKGCGECWRPDMGIGKRKKRRMELIMVQKNSRGATGMGKRERGKRRKS